MNRNEAIFHRDQSGGLEDVDQPEWAARSDGRAISDSFWMWNRMRSTD